MYIYICINDRKKGFWGVGLGLKIEINQEEFLITVKSSFNNVNCKTMT